MRPRNQNNFDNFPNQSQQMIKTDFSFLISPGTCRYDIDNSGAIDKQEMLKVMKSIYAMVSVCVY